MIFYISRYAGIQLTWMYVSAGNINKNISTKTNQLSVTDFISLTLTLSSQKAWVALKEIL